MATRKSTKRRKAGEAKKARRSAAAKKSRPTAAPNGEFTRLTEHVRGGGCASKLGPGELGALLAGLPRQRDPRLLVGNETNDDAGVFRLRTDLAIVNTVDFFPPLVDDPFQFGQIAAANAMSDIYAMGGRPVTALNVVAFPNEVLAAEVLAAVLAGGAERAAAAGAVVVGGHTICDTELKYGMAVTGLVHPDRMIRNGGARVGDRLVLTKALGTGIVATGIKRRAAEPAEEEAAIASMIALNDAASSLLHRHRARACTDITGFGLAGHALEMAMASGAVRLELEAAAIGLLPGVARLAEAEMVTGGSKRNRAYVGRRLAVGKDVSAALGEAIMDPQTSGGLLVSLPAREAPDYVERLHAHGLRPALIGRVVRRPKTSPVHVAVE